MKKNLGLTLIELLIAITLGLLVITGIGFLFLQSSQSYRENENVGTMQENARFSLQLLSNELRHAGFFGGILRGDSVEIDPSVSINGIDCGTGTDDWLTDLSKDIVYTAASDVASAYSSDCADDISAGSDALEIRSVLAEEVAAADLQANHLYVRTNITSGCIWMADVDGSGASPDSTNLCPTGSTSKDWKLVSNLYYISTADAANPKLCRKQINQGNAATGMKEECFTDGMERFYIEFGVDTSGTGLVYTSAPANFKQVVTARIYLLTRSPRKALNYSSDKAYSLGSDPLVIAAANDSYKRRIYSTTVLLRNIVNLRNF